MSAVIDLLRDAGVECYTREQWGSPRQADGSYAKRRVTHPMPDGPARYHFIHITVTSDTDTAVGGKAKARDVESFGLSTPPMVSYHDLVTNEGRYFEGQSYGVKGTHTINETPVPGYPFDLNLYGYATAIMQNVQDPVTDIQVDVIAKVLAAREILGLVKKGAEVLPHRMFDPVKSCPGDKMFARLGDVRRLRTHYVENGLEDDMGYSKWTDEDKRLFWEDMAERLGKIPGEVWRFDVRTDPKLNARAALTETFEELQKEHQ